MQLRPRSAIRQMSLLVCSLLFASACGSSSDPAVSGAGDAPSDAAPNTAAANDAAANDADPADGDAADSEPDIASNQDAEAGSGQQTATLSLADGTVYELVVSSCVTNETDSARLPITDGFEVAGKTADGIFEFSILRGGFDDDPYQSGIASADFDQSGGQQTSYNVDVGTMIYAVDGASVSATFTLGEFGKKGIHGDTVEATLEAHC